MTQRTSVKPSGFRTATTPSAIGTRTRLRSTCRFIGKRVNSPARLKSSKGIPEIVLPGNLAEINREGSMAYVMCLHQLGRGYTDAEVQAATEQFLKRSVRDWLDRGQFPTVARWMKLAYWRGEESRQAAWQSLLRCYDFLPGVKRPTG